MTAQQQAAQTQQIPEPDEQPLFCTPEIALAISNEITLLKLAKKDMALVFGAANWQRDRVVEHFKAKLVEVQGELKETESPNVVARLGTDRAFFHGRLKGKIELLETLIRDFK